MLETKSVVLSAGVCATVIFVHIIIKFSFISINSLSLIFSIPRHLTPLFFMLNSCQLINHADVLLRNSNWPRIATSLSSLQRSPKFYYANAHHQILDNCVNVTRNWLILGNLLASHTLFHSLITDTSRTNYISPGNSLFKAPYHTTKKILLLHWFLLYGPVFL